MRTIKFRGRLSNGEWRYGDLITYKSGEAAIANFSRYGYECSDMNRVLVGLKTVGQFTGLFDEDGREIYEGDIIKIVEEFDDENVYTRNGVVCFAEGIFELQDKNGKHFAYLGWMQNDDAITKLEVVGNIHDTTTKKCWRKEATNEKESSICRP